jgi:alkanesulfonate monooxygenase SsuD/methylene tetrahydromethanopterin reductase-like flavin-dependent oxidoreductase (luciferase family)
VKYGLYLPNFGPFGDARLLAELARETVSLDRLSNGRLVFGAGLGSSGGADVEWAALGEETDLVRRAHLLDEGLEILNGLWSGEPFDFSGRGHAVRGAQFLPKPLQSPRIPVWIAGYWPRRAPVLRAARWDGLFALFRDGPPHDVAQLGEAVALVRASRTSDAPFDVVYCADRETPAEPYARAGATWLLAHLKPDSFGASWTEPWPLERMRARIASGPPRS